MKEYFFHILILNNLFIESPLRSPVLFYRWNIPLDVCFTTTFYCRNSLSLCKTNFPPLLQFRRFKEPFSNNGIVSSNVNILHAFNEIMCLIKRYPQKDIHRMKINFFPVIDKGWKLSMKHNSHQVFYFLDEIFSNQVSPRWK